MPPTRSSRQGYKQQTLLRFLTSPPPSSPSNRSQKSPSPSPSHRKQTSSSSSRSSNASDTDSDVGAIRFEPEPSDEDHSPRRPKKRTSTRSIATRTSGAESSDEITAEPRHRKGKRGVVLDPEDDIRPRKRKLIKGIRPPTPEEDDDILEKENQVLENRLRSRGKMTAFQKKLEKLKTLKGKKRSEIVLKSSSEAEQSENSARVPFKGAKPHRSGESLDEADASSEEDDDNFIVDDDAPAARLPLAFSLSAHQDLTHQFKIICQLFVHLAVQPLVDRRPFFERALKEEEYLSVPLQITRRKLCGMRDSLVASSVWKSNFKKALETYPEFTLVALDFTIPQCDACHLGNRVSTMVGRLSGKPYGAYDFEDLSGESDESQENDDDDEDEGSNRDVGQEFHLGRFCAARTQVYHQFSHWEYSLYKALQREVLEARDESRRFVKVAYIGGIKPPRDLHDGDRVMEWLDERGIIDMEWQRVRQMMDRARNLERGEIDGQPIL